MGPGKPSVIFVVSALFRALFFLFFSRRWFGGIRKNLVAEVVECFSLVRTGEACTDRSTEAERRCSGQRFLISAYPLNDGARKLE